MPAKRSKAVETLQRDLATLEGWLPSKALAALQSVQTLFADHDRRLAQVESDIANARAGVGPEVM
jgi:hypothetical protein